MRGKSSDRETGVVSHEQFRAACALCGMGLEPRSMCEAKAYDHAFSLEAEAEKAVPTHQD